MLNKMCVKRSECVVLVLHVMLQKKKNNVKYVNKKKKQKKNYEM